MPPCHYLNKIYDPITHHTAMRTFSPFTNVSHVLLLSCASAYILLAEEEATTILQVENPKKYHSRSCDTISSKVYVLYHHFFVFSRRSRC